jgi:DNA-binding LacI/PurR family transcriptional regulator
MSKGAHKRRPTSLDVARLAGVSQTTVSLVLNEVSTATISEDTRTRVREAIAQLDYYPHEGARSMIRRATHSLGVAIPDTNNPYCQEIVAGIEEYADSRGYSVVVIGTNFDVARERRCLLWLKQRRFDALIRCSGTGSALEEETLALRNQGYHVTALGLEHVAPDIDCVTPPAQTGEQLLVDHLAELGHQRIGHIYGVADHQNLGERLATCLTLQQARGFPIVDAWVRRCGPTIGEAYAATEAMLSECEPANRPSALIVVNDLLAMGVLAALSGAGIQVPTTMSVASFDNTPLATYTIPPLTSVDQDSRTLGRQAARVTIERLATPDGPPMFVETTARLAVRKSTGSATVNY